MKKLFSFLPLLAILFSCTTEADENAYENGANSSKSAIESDLFGYGFSPDQMEMVTLPSGVVVGKVDDMYVIDGDIILSPKQVEALSQPTTRGNIDDLVKQFPGYWAWPNGEIPVVFPLGFPRNLMTTIMDCTLEYNNKTCLNFREKNSNDPFWVEFVAGTNANGGASYLGRTVDYGVQQVFIDPAADRTAILHELAHLIGLEHEYNRTDRDTYLTLASNQLSDPAFQKRGVVHGPFNYNSITMLSGIARKDCGARTRGNSKVSFGDAAAINAIYNLPAPTSGFAKPEIAVDMYASFYNGPIPIPGDWAQTALPPGSYQFECTLIDNDLKLYDYLKLSIEAGFVFNDGQVTIPVDGRYVYTAGPYTKTYTLKSGYGSIYFNWGGHEKQIDIMIN